MSLKHPVGKSTDPQIPDSVWGLSESFGVGMEQIYLRLRSDGALPASFKALLTAVAGAVTYQNDLTGQSQRDARDRGIESRDVSSVALLILLNRGAKAYELFVDRGIEVFGHLPPVAREVDEVIIGTLDQAKDYFLAHFGGELPARQQLFSEALPEAFVGYSMMHRTAINESSLPARYAEMVLCTAMSATYQFSLLPVHVSGARKHGASDAELAESVLCAVPASGVTAWVGGAGAIRSVS